MNWKTKIKIQDLIAKLPQNYSDDIYYVVQKLFGNLKNIYPDELMKYGLIIANSIKNQNRDIVSKTFLEIGTGRRLIYPIALWLCGAERIITVDIEKKLKEDLIEKDIVYLKRNSDLVVNMFKGHLNSSISQERLLTLTKIKTPILSNLKKTLNLEYIAPYDIKYFSDNEFDYVFSVSALEHIPRIVILNILKEGIHLLKKNGLFIHIINFADHSAISDKSITKIHFLKFSDNEWDRIARNKFCYHNRMRIDDYISLFEEVGLRVLTQSSRIDKISLNALERGFFINEKFQQKSNEINATRDAVLVLSPNHNFD